MEAVGRIWDLRSGKCILVLQGHVKSVLAIDFSPNGFHIVTGAEDHTVRLWDLRARRSLYQIPAHTNLVSQVAYESMSRLSLWGLGGR